jgi:hypothetical protein
MSNPNASAPPGVPGHVFLATLRECLNALRVDDPARELLLRRYAHLLRGGSQ